MKTRKFQRTKEDFICEHCGQEVKGNGYTNHCPNCLWSRHVDVNPGDRQAACRGMMEPIKIDSKNGEYVIVHRCVKCGFERRNKVVQGDNFQLIIKIAQHPR